MGVYAVELFCAKVPALESDKLLEALKKRCPQVQLFGDQLGENALSFVHPDQQVAYSKGSIPAQTIIAVGGRPDAKALAGVVQQSWAFEGAGEALAKSNGSVLVSDLMAVGLERKVRLGLFQRVLDSVLEVIPATAIHWQPAQQIINAKEYRSTASRKYPDLQSGAFNVRLFRLEGGYPDEILMDSRGLDIFGLPDVQCHFRKLDPGKVARILYNTAMYIFDKGDVIQDGHTITGLSPIDRWKAQHQKATIGPERTVLDLVPGREFAVAAKKK